MQVQSTFLHVGGLELVELEHTPEVGVQVLVWSLTLCYILHQSDVWQRIRGIHPEIPQVAFFGQYLGHEYPMKTFSKIPVDQLH